MPDEVTSDERLFKTIDDMARRYDTEIVPEATELLGNTQGLQRSMRERREVERLMYAQTKHLDKVHNLPMKNKPTMEYDATDMIILAIVLEEMEYMEYHEGTQCSQ